MFKCSNVQKLKCSNIKCQMSIKYLWSSSCHFLICRLFSLVNSPYISQIVDYMPSQAAMASTLFCLFLSFTFASGMLLPADQRNRWILNGEPEQGRNALKRNQERQGRSANSQSNLKVLDFCLLSLSAEKSSTFRLL